MSDASTDLGAPTPDAAPAAPRPQNRTWRGRGQLKLVGARNGAGTLVWSGRAIPAAYELDVFAQGETRTVQGKLEGDFSDLIDGDADAGRARLRLDDGREIEIDVVDLEPWGADFEVKGANVYRSLGPLRFESTPT
jgi:hypothetical protein